MYFESFVQSVLAFFKSLKYKKKNILWLGPIASMLVNKYGCRTVTFMGSVLAAFGLAISALAKSLIVLYFTIGKSYF